MLLFPSQGNDHRFAAAPQHHLRIRSFSRVFDFRSKDSWTSKLAIVHKQAWQIWQEHLRGKPEFGLAESEIQEGGIIHDAVIAECAEAISHLTEKTRYGKAKPQEDLVPLGVDELSSDTEHKKKKKKDKKHKDKKHKKDKKDKKHMKEKSASAWEQEVGNSVA